MKTLLRILLYTFVAVLIVLFLVPFPLKVAWELVFGWIAFLGRTLPKVMVNWNVIGMSVLCTAVLLAALHSFFAWLARARNARRGGNSGQLLRFLEFCVRCFSPRWESRGWFTRSRGLRHRMSHGR